MSGKHPSTIFTDQDAVMAAAIAFVFPNTIHRLCLWYIYLNAAKHLGHVIHVSDDKSDNKSEDQSDNKFLADFKRCIYEDRTEAYFIEKWDGLNWLNTTLRITHGWQTYMPSGQSGLQYTVTLLQQKCKDVTSVKIHPIKSLAKKLFQNLFDAELKSFQILFCPRS